MEGLFHPLAQGKKSNSFSLKLPDAKKDEST
jgi:hypothetical protein